MTRPAPLDELDYQIILELRQDARRSASDIARQTGANERTIRNRIDRLIECGAVRLPPSSTRTPLATSTQ
jgi:DNA-binding Lrp family transcriptional regulator